MIRVGYKKDNTYGNTMYEFINNDLIMKWFTDRCGDLYWVLFTRDINSNDEYDFNIGIQNYKLYSIIDQIYNDFKDGTIFHEKEIDKDLKYNSVVLNRNQYIREKVHEIYNANTEDLYWDSDDDLKERANCIRIIKEKNKYVIRFCDLIHGNLIRVCFKKNRSYYGPCSLPFFRAYDAMNKIKDDYTTSFDEYFGKVKPELEKDNVSKTYSKKNEN